MSARVVRGTRVDELLHQPGGILHIMNSNQLESQWNQVKGSVRQKYNKLTEEDVREIGGKKDQFISKLQERYGMSREQAQKDLDSFVQGLQTGAEVHAHTAGGGTKSF